MDKRTIHAIEQINKKHTNANLLNLNLLQDVLRTAEQAYAEGEPIMTDGVYDYVRDLVERQEEKTCRPLKGATTPPIKSLKLKKPVKKGIRLRAVVAAPPVELKHVPKAKAGTNLVRSPYWLGSMDKLKQHDPRLATWTSSYGGPYVISAKMDGISALLFYDGSHWRLITRGRTQDESQDISNLLPYLEGRTLPNLTELDKSLVVRGELIMSDHNFKSLKEGKHPRNTVAGVANHAGKNMEINSRYNSKIEMIDFVTYEIITSSAKQPKNSQQLDTLVRAGFQVVPHQVVDSIDDVVLTNKLEELERNMDYAIDGLVIYSDKSYPRNKRANPSYARAYKKSLDEAVLVEVQDISWQISSRGYLKPVIHIEPTLVDGAEVSKVTGHNAKNIIDNMLGRGAKFLLTRSGHVIPYIQEVVKPSTKANLEAVMPKIKHTWNETEVDFVANLDEQEGAMDEVNITRMTAFVKTIGAKGLAKAKITAMFERGIDTIAKLMKVTSDQLSFLGPRDSVKMANAVHDALKDLSLIKLMVGSKLMPGIGQRKLELLFSELPDLVDQIIKNTVKPKEWLAVITGVEGFAAKSSRTFVDNLEDFMNFYNTIFTPELVRTLEYNTQRQADQHDEITAPVATSSELSGKNILFTGFRDKEMASQIARLGGKVVSSGPSSTTNYLIVKDSSVTNKKTEKATGMSIPVMSRDEFIARFFA